MTHFEKKVSETEIFKGQVFTVTVDKARLENDSLATREIVHHNGGACVVPLSAEGDVYLVRQYRYAFGEELWELPAGKIEPGEDPFETAKRELAEECGLAAARFVDLGLFYPTVGYCTEIIYTWLAQDLSECEANPDEDEFLSLEKLPLATAVQMVMDGRIRDGKTVAGILKVDALLRAGKL